MAKTPVKISIIRRAVALIKRNPIRSATAVLGFLAVVPGGIGGLIYLDIHAEPYYLTQHYRTREFIDEKTAPILKVQSESKNELDYLILKDLRAALKDAKSDLEKHPDSTTAPHEIERIQKSIEKRQNRLDDTPKK